MTKKYFGTDGIRGTVNQGHINGEKFFKFGLAAGTYFINQKKTRQTAIIAKDTRLSGYTLEPALVSGLASAGMHIFTLGPLPTNGLAMLTKKMKANVGIMITASHNPYYDNGLKLFGPDGSKLSDSIEKKIERIIDSQTSAHLSKANTLGRVKRLEDANENYIKILKKNFPKNFSLKGIKIVIDCANGAGYKAGPKLLSSLDAQVIAIGVKPNGLNINDKCGSTYPNNISKAVKKHKADLGIALDGDADRKMKNYKYNLGGEQSGHIILGKFATTGDGLLVALEVLFSLRKGKKASELFDVFKSIPQILENIAVKDKNIIFNSKTKLAIKKAEKLIKNQGRLLVRKSGTEPKVRIMGESINKNLLQKCIQIIKHSLK